MAVNAGLLTLHQKVLVGGVNVNLRHAVQHRADAGKRFRQHMLHEAGDVGVIPVSAGPCVWLRMAVAFIGLDCSHWAHVQAAHAAGAFCVVDLWVIVPAKFGLELDCKGRACIVTQSAGDAGKR